MAQGLLGHNTNSTSVSSLCFLHGFELEPTRGGVKATSHSGANWQSAKPRHDGRGRMVSGPVAELDAMCWARPEVDLSVSRSLSK
jgi:hypothetical protein